MTFARRLPVVQSTAGFGDAKVGVYVCHCGGNISDVVDVKAVAEAAGVDPNVAVSKDFLFMCSDPGQQLIIEDIEKQGINRVVVAACSPALHESTFRRALSKAGLNPYLYQHVNVREQCSWVHKADHPGATAKAARLVRAGARGAALKQSLDAIHVSAEHRVAVIGGVLAGMRASLALADIGLPVILLERSAELGGALRRIGKLHQNGELGSEVADELKEQVEARSLIEVVNGAVVEKIEGCVGQFRLLLQEREPVTAGALVLATGFSDYRPQLGEFGWGDPHVVTLAELLQELPTLPVSRDGSLLYRGRSVRHLAIVHCVGSRQIDGVHQRGADGRLNEHCSRVCCAAAMNAINQIQDRFSGTQVYDLYRDIRTYGRGQETLYQRAGQGGALFFRYPEQVPPVIEPAPEGSEQPLRIRVKDDLTWGEELVVPVDLVVLATGMLPSPIPELIESQKLPVGSDGFLLEAHPKLRPVEVANNGIFLAGTCQAPMDASEAAAGAGAAAAKAGILLSEAEIALDPFVATVREDRCNGCGDCIEQCSYQGAILMVDRDTPGPNQSKSVATVNPALCKGCGACVAVCEPRALDVAGWSLDQYEAMVDAIVA